MLEPHTQRRGKEEERNKFAFSCCAPSPFSAEPTMASLLARYPGPSPAADARASAKEACGDAVMKDCGIGSWSLRRDLTCDSPWPPLRIA